MKQLVYRFFVVATFVLSMCGNLPAAPTAAGIEVKSVFQTTGQGNLRDALLRMSLKGGDDACVKFSELTVCIDETTCRNIDELHVYGTMSPEYYAEAAPALLGVAKPKTGIVRIKADRRLAAGSFRYLWLTCKVKQDAALGEYICAEVKTLKAFADGSKSSFDLSGSSGVQGRGVKIFKQQQFLFVPTTYGCRFYRIPAMTTDRNGNLVVAADLRYDSNGDLGEHKIDVVVRRSSDGGRTWTPQQFIAVGDGQNDDTYGYGDAALATTGTGRIVCLLSAGKNNFFRGMHNIGITYSDDDGKTWTEPRELTAHRFTDAVHGLVDSLGFWSVFATSGRGLLMPDGRIMFAANCIGQPNTYTIDCYMLTSADNGESWQLGRQCAYRACDESKLAMMNDGSLLLSVRQDGNRGFNRCGSDGESWQQQWRTADMTGNACNADMMYYSRETDGEKDIILHTLINDRERKNLTLYRSTDKGMTWHELMNIQPGGAAYSTMVKLPGGDVAIFYEDDSYSADNGYHLNFIVVSREQITAK